MLHRDKQDLQGKRLRLPGNPVAGFFSWSAGVLESVARMLRWSEKPCASIPAKAPANPCISEPEEASDPLCVSGPVEEPGRRSVVEPVKEPGQCRANEVPVVGSDLHPASEPTLVEPEQPGVLVPANEAGKPCVIVPPKAPEKRAERPVFPARCIVFSDTDNDMNSVRNTLRFAGILDGKGELAASLNGISILHTGDLIDKKNPAPSVVEYWQHLQQDALAKGAHVKLVVGNHEQEVWQKIEAGEKYGLGAKRARWLKAFIESLDLFYVAGPVLFIHGYPTLEFLQTLLHFKEVTGKDLNCFNADHYKKAFRSVNAMKQYAYVKENRRPHYLLYDVADASRYYKKQGRMVSAVLAQLQIDIVIHGHRPQRSGVQVDYEFARWIPKIRMIGNDTMVRRRGIGATVISTTSSNTLDMVFINTKTKSGKLRRKIQKDLRELQISSSASHFTRPGDAALKSVAQG